MKLKRHPKKPILLPDLSSDWEGEVHTEYNHKVDGDSIKQGEFI